MFDLGFRQVVIDDDAVIKAETIDTVNYINIEGYGKFEVAGSILNEFKDPETKILGSTDILTPTGWSMDQVWEIKVFISEGKNGGGYGNIRESGQIAYFQVALPLDVNGGTMPATFIEALKVSVDQFKLDNGGVEKFSYLTFVGSTFSFEPGYEGLTVSKVTATKIYDPQESGFDDRFSLQKNITSTITEGSFGFGYPIQVEASVQNNTPYTLDPYKSRFGGNDIIDFSVNTMYTEVSWITSKDHYDGILMHDMPGYGDANTESSYKEREYSVYIKSSKEGSAVNAAGIALLKTI